MIPIPELNRAERLIASAYRNRLRLLAVVVLAVIALAVLVSQHQRPTLAELEAVRATIYPQNQPQNQGVKHYDGK